MYFISYYIYFSLLKYCFMIPKKQIIKKKKFIKENKLKIFFYINAF